MIFLAPLAVKAVSWIGASYVVGKTADAVSNANGFDDSGNYVPESEKQETSTFKTVMVIATIGAVGMGGYYVYKKVK